MENPAEKRVGARVGGVAVRVAILSSAVASALSLVYLVASFYPDDAEVFLFPRIISVLMAALCVFLWIDAFTGSGRDAAQGDGFPGDILPGLGIGALYLSILEAVGFYTASFLAFFAIAVVYSGDSGRGFKPILKKLVIAALFMVILYLLFWQGLHMRTPRGFLF